MITQLPSQHSMLGHHRHASEMAFRWRTEDGLLIVVKTTPPPPPHHKKRIRRKGVVSVGPPPLTKLSGSAHMQYIAVCTLMKCHSMHHLIGGYTVYCNTFKRLDKGNMDKLLHEIKATSV